MMEKQTTKVSRRMCQLAASLLLAGGVPYLTLAAEALRVAKWQNDTKACFLLAFDDGCPSQLKNAIPILDEYKIPGTFYLYPEGGHFAWQKNTWAQAARSEYIVLGNHTIDHKGVQSAADLESSVRKCAEALKAMTPDEKWPRLVSFAVPGGVPWKVSKAEVKDILARNHHVERPDYHGPPYFCGKKEEALKLIDTTIAKGGLEHLDFHGVGGDWLSASPDYLEAICQKLDGARDEIWAASAIDAHKYATERDAAKLEKVSVTATKVGFTLTTPGLDEKLYDLPLTVVVPAPGWKAAKVTVGGKSETIEVKSGRALVSVRSGAVRVEKAEAAAVTRRVVAKDSEGDAKWTPCGWGGGGWFWSSAADPKNADVFYMGGDVNGLWKTTNGGRSWKFANAGLPNYEVYTLAVAPSDGETVYALTVDGVAVSTDGAKSWTHCKDTKRSGLNVGSSRGGSIHAIAVDYKDPKIVYAGGKSGRAVKSTDGGRNWRELDYLSSRTPEEGETAKAASGSGFARIQVALNPNDWKNYVRVQKFISQGGDDWNDAKTISAKVFLPKDAPAGMAATIVVQSGGWAWNEGPMKMLRPGAWTTIEYPLSTYKDAHKVNMVHFVLRSNGKGFTGEVSLDAFVVKGGSETITLGEWDGADTEGWVVSPDGNTKSVTKSIKPSKAPASAPAGGTVRTIAVNGANNTTVLLCNQQRGLFRSADAGKTWAHMKDAPGDANCVFWAGAKQPKTWFGAFGKNGIFISTDDGLTWKSLNAPIQGGMGARDVVASWKDPNAIWAIIGSGFGGHILRTVDGGQTWTRNASFKADNKGNPTLPGNGATGNMSGLENLSISQVNPKYLHMAGNWDPCFTHNGGETWVESVRGADITCFHDIRHLGAETYGAAMDEGICMTTDGGTWWKALAPLKWKAGLSGHQWQILPLKLKNGETRIISTVSPWAHNGDFPVKMLVSDDSGKTFVEAKGLPTYRTHKNTMWGEGHGRTLQADPTNPDIIYVGIDGDPENGHTGGGIFKSTDGGKTFAQLPNQPGSRRMMYGLSIDPTNPKRLVWGACGETSGVYVSEDGGASWAKTPNLSDWIFRTEVTKKGTIYAGGNQLYRSDDHGKSFRAVSNLRGVTVCGIAYDPADENRVWISGTTWSSNADAPNTGVYETTDGCKTWHKITGDIPYRKPVVLRYNETTKELWAAGPGAYKLKR